MESGESPLDVLSRAATMVQENQAMATNDETSDTSKQGPNKQLPTAKWKRDRRSRLPEYSRKSDPKIPEVFEQQQESSPERRPNGYTNGATSAVDTPLDMSIRHRGQPPSYSQTVNNPGYRSSYRPSVIQNSGRDDIPSGMSMCDPIIDEHFRRSLGKDYLALFSNNNVSKESSGLVPLVATQPQTTRRVTSNATDSAGLSVDDHFAKALGETWLKLNGKKEGDIKNEDNQGVLSM